MMASVTALLVLPNLFRLRHACPNTPASIDQAKPQRCREKQSTCGLVTRTTSSIDNKCTPQNVILIYVYVWFDKSVLGICVIYHQIIYKQM